MIDCPYCGLVFPVLDSHNTQDCIMTLREKLEESQKENRLQRYDFEDRLRHLENQIDKLWQSIH